MDDLVLQVDQSNVIEVSDEYAIVSDYPGKTGISSGTLIEECVHFSENLVIAKHLGSFLHLGNRSWAVHLDRIGRYCSIGNNVLIGAGPHPTNWLSTSTFFYRRSAWKSHPLVREFYEDHQVDYNFDRAPGSIGNDVWIGSDAVVMMGVEIGDGAIVGANSTVTKDVPPYAIVAGNPAKIIRYRFDESLIQKLMALQWWNINPLKLKGLDYSDISRCVSNIEEINASENALYEPRAVFTKDWVTV